MNRQEYMKQLKQVLAGVDQEIAQDIIEDYENHFEQALGSGRTEQEVIEELGSIEEFKEELKQFIKEDTTNSYTGPGEKDTADDSGSRRGGRTAAQDWSEYGRKIENILNSTVKTAASGIDQLGTQLDRAFEKVSEVFKNYEASGESEESYRRRQENARAQVNVVRFKKEKEQDTEERDAKEQSCVKIEGMVTQAEEVQSVSLEAKAVEVEVVASEDENFHYCLENCSDDRALNYFVEKRISQGTLYLSIESSSDYKTNKKHFDFLVDLFGDSADVTMRLYVPTWLTGLNIKGKTSDVTVDKVSLETLQCRNLSGDIVCRNSNIKKAMLECASGDTIVQNGSYGHLVLSAKTGDAQVSNISAERTLLRSLSGDVVSKNVSSREMELVTVSGDAVTVNNQVTTIHVQSTSGDVRVNNLEGTNVYVATVSGDLETKQVNAKNFISSNASGDQDLNSVKAEKTSVSTASGDVSLRGTSSSMNLSSANGDITVVQSGDTVAKISTNNGEVNFHLDNKGNGFIAQVKTQGEIGFRYNDLVLVDAASGEHCYGAEGSRLDISSGFGDIYIKD